MSASRSAPPRPGTTCAIPLAKLTAAACTPGCLASTFCTRAAHEPHVMPCTVKSSAGQPGAGSVPATAVSATAADLIPLLFDGGVQRRTGDHGLVVGHPDPPARHVHVAGPHPRHPAHRPPHPLLAL